jgi:MoaA/NifB/PqqE/SkfB family radical SAM enzyme
VSADIDHRPTGQKYGFYGRLNKEFPSQFILDITEVCNLACTHCPHPAFSVSEHYDARMLDPELNAKLVDEVRVHGAGSTQYIRYTSNGEPTAHPKCFDMLEYAVKNSGTTVTLTTNGKTLDAARCERLLLTGVNLVDISLDAHTPGTYAKIRVRGDLNVTRPNVLNLIKRSREVGGLTKVVVSYVEQPTNESETAEFEKYWKDQGADYVVVRRLHSCSGANKDLAAIRRKSAPMRRPCLYPWERMVLSARGDLSFCPSDWVHGSVVADYRTTTIRETWNGDFYRSLREAHLKNDFKKHPFCGQCPDWQATRWPEEGRSYADMVSEFKETE